MRLAWFGLYLLVSIWIVGMASFSTGRPVGGDGLAGPWLLPSMLLALAASAWLSASVAASAVVAVRRDSASGLATSASGASKVANPHAIFKLE